MEQKDITAANIRVTYNFGFERRLNFPIFDLFPVDSSEKLISSHVFFAFFSASEPFGRILR